jgi:hypothetical protein
VNVPPDLLHRAHELLAQKRQTKLAHLVSNKSILLNLRSLELNYLAAFRKLLALVLGCLLRHCVLLLSLAVLPSPFIAYGEGGTACDLLAQGVLPSQLGVVGQLDRVCLLRCAHHYHVRVGLYAICFVDLLVVDDVDEHDVIRFLSLLLCENA